MINCDRLPQRRWFVLGRTPEQSYTALLGTFSSYEKAKSKLVPLALLLEMPEKRKVCQDLLNVYLESLHISYTDENPDITQPGLLNELYSASEDKLLQMDLALRLQDCEFLSGTAQPPGS